MIDRCYQLLVLRDVSPSAARPAGSKLTLTAPYSESNVKVASANMEQRVLGILTKWIPGTPGYKASAGMCNTRVL